MFGRTQQQDDLFQMVGEEINDEDAPDFNMNEGFKRKAAKTPVNNRTNKNIFSMSKNK